MKKWLEKNLDVDGIMSGEVIVELQEFYMDYVGGERELMSPADFRVKVEEYLSEIVERKDYVIVTDFYIFSVSSAVFDLYQFLDKNHNKFGTSFALVDMADFVERENNIIDARIGSKLKAEICRYFSRCRRCHIDKTAQGKKFISNGPYTKKIKRVSFIKK